MTIVITNSTTVTGADIVTRAARALGYLGRNETMSAADMTDGLIAFNTLLDSWSNEGLMSNVGLQRRLPLVIGTQTYTIGSGGTVNTTRPSVIDLAWVRDSSNIDYPLDILTQEQFAGIGQKGNTSQIPTVLYYYPSYPLGVINIFPVPMLAYTVYYITTQDQVTFSLPTQTLSMPGGYERAFVMNLALELMSAGYPCMLADRQLALLINAASDAKANVKRSNMVQPVATFDPAIVSHGSGTFNIYTNGYPRT